LDDAIRKSKNETLLAAWKKWTETYIELEKNKTLHAGWEKNRTLHAGWEKWSDKCIKMERKKSESKKRVTSSDGSVEASADKNFVGACADGEWYYALGLLQDETININQADARGWTAAYYASITSEEFLQALLKHGADPNLATAEGVTPLMRASQLANVGKMKLLIESGADVNHCENNGLTALHYAANKDSLDAIRLLLGHGARINAFSKC
jgi:hypothetical protein